MTDDTNTPEVPGIDIAALTEEITKKVMADLDSRDERERIKRIDEREKNKTAHQKYVDAMKESDEPWVEILGDVEQTAQGVRIAIEWNDAFITFLKSAGITGLDDEQIVQHWVALLTQDMVEQMEGGSTDQPGPEKI